jgi:hypothetical protein
MSRVESDAMAAIADLHCGVGGGLYTDSFCLYDAFRICGSSQSARMAPLRVNSACANNFLLLVLIVRVSMR